MAKKKATDTGASGDNDEVLILPSADDWMELLKTKLDDTGDKGETAHEIAAKTPQAHETIRKKLKLAVLAGTVIEGRAKRADCNGRWQTVPVYRPAENNEKGN